MQYTDSGIKRSGPASHNVHGWFARVAAGTLLVFCVALDIVCLRSTAESPDVGARFSTQGHAVVVAEVRKTSALSQAGIQEGDTLLAIQGRIVDETAFLSDPYLAKTWEQRHLYEEWKLFLGRLSLSPQTQIKMCFRQAGEEREVLIPVKPLGYSNAWKRSWPLRLVGWTFFLASWLIWRRKRGETADINLLGGFSVFGSLVMSAAVFNPDLAPLSDTFVLLLPILWLVSQSSILTLHLGLVFPTPSSWISQWPWLRWIPWGLYAVEIPLHFLRLLPGPVYTSYTLSVVSLIGFMGMIVIRFWRERNPLAHQQMQWVVLGGIGGFLPYTVFSALPLALGVPGIPQEISLLFAIVTPICLSFAIHRYRLLDVGSVFDFVLVHGVTFTLLMVLEFFLWSWVGEYLPGTRPTVLLPVSMAIVVFLYAPLRLRIIHWQRRLSGTLRPPVVDAVQKLLLLTRHSGHPEQALEETLQWSHHPETVYTTAGEGVQGVMEQLELHPDGLLGMHLDHCPPGQEASMWIPMRTHAGLVAVVLDPMLSRGWTRYDLSLASTLVHTAEPLLALQDLDREHRAKEAALVEQREEVLREMHDGLGSQLFGLSLLAQEGDVPLGVSQLQDRMKAIAAASSDAVDSLRTGLTVLGSPPGAFGPCFLAQVMRAERWMSRQGIQLTTSMDEDVSEFQMESGKLFSLLRAVQEALTNIVRHSQCQRAEVRASVERGMLLILVRDDGCGFDSRQGRRDGYGLQNIERRMLMLEGRAHIRSVPGAGAEILLEVPL